MSTCLKVLIARGSANLLEITQILTDQGFAEDHGYAGRGCKPKITIGSECSSCNEYFIPDIPQTIEAWFENWAANCRCERCLEAPSGRRSTPCADPSEITSDLYDSQSTVVDGGFNYTAYLDVSPEASGDGS
jgi:hypothetical protein